MTLTLDALCVEYDERAVLKDLDLEIPKGLMTSIIGPNGSGKSTLLKAMAHLIEPAAGNVSLEGQPVQTLKRRMLARRVAILPQSPLAPEGISVGDLVRRGRTPWRGALSPWSAQDRQAWSEALHAVQLYEDRDRPLSELSGGQQQRAWLGLVLAQQTPWLLLDEPTSFLDLPHQLELLELLQRRKQEAQLSVVCVLHELNMAARFSDVLIMLGHEGVVASGSPEQVITEAHLKQAFGLHARVQTDPVSGRPMVIPEAHQHRR